MTSDQSIREKIRQEIQAHPGTYRKQLCRRLGISWGTVSYHLQILKATDEVLEEPHRGRQLLFPPGYPHDAIRRASALSGPRRHRLYEVLRAENPIGIHDLSVRLGLSRKVVRRMLEDFQDHGLVEREPGHHGRFLLADDRGLDSRRGAWEPFGRR